jgi:hypothetical protein
MFLVVASLSSRNDATASPMVMIGFRLVENTMWNINMALTDSKLAMRFEKTLAAQ